MESNSINRNKRILSVLQGLFFILLSGAMVLNMGYIMRTLVGASIFLFGITTYAFDFFLLVQGFSLIIRGKLLLPSKRWKLIPYIFAIVFMLILVSCIEIHLFNFEHSDDIIRDFFVMYNNFDGGFYSRSFINLFTVPFGGGLIGNLFSVPLIMLMGKAGTIGLISSLLFLTLAILYGFDIYSFIKKHKAKKEGAKDENNPLTEEETTEQTPQPELVETPETHEKKKKHRLSRKERHKLRYQNSFEKESDIFLHASEVGTDEVMTLSKSNDISPVDFDRRSDSLLPSDIQMNKPMESGGLEKVHLDLFSEKKESRPIINPEPIKQAEPEIIPSSSEEETVIVPDYQHDVAPSYNAVPAVEETKPIVKETKKEEAAPIVDTVIEEKPVIKTIEKESKIEKIDVEIKNTHIDWVPPSTDALITYQTEEQVQANIDSAKQKLEVVNQAFADFNIQAQVVDFVIGPSITRLLVDYPATGSIKAVDKIKTDVSRRLNGVPLRFAETVPGTPYSGFEVPNPVPATVSFKEVFEALPDATKHPTAVSFGKDIAGKVISADICDFPHMLISGTSGSGKSVFVNSLIVTLMARTSPQDLKIVLVDPKRVEMNRYRDEPHLFCPVINDSNEAKVMLYKMVDYMNNRYKTFEEADYATSLKDYNKWAVENNRKTMPYIIIVLDEYADLAYSCKEVSIPLVSICQKARACGIHVIVSTQRPSTDVITGTIKANLQTRVSLTAAGTVDSMTVLDEGGAEDLLGNGDMLVKSPLVSRTGLTRLQGCYIQGKEIAYIVNYLKQNYTPEYDPDFLDLSEHEPEVNTNSAFNSPLGESGDSDEEKYQWIKEWASMQEYVSMSKIQRECSVGFNRAGKIVKRLQEEGILSTDSEGSNKGFKVINGQSRFNDAPDLDSSELNK